MQPGLTVTSVPLNIDVPPSPRGALAPAVSYKFIKLDQSESKDGSDPTPKFMLAGQDANDALLLSNQSKHVKNRKVSHICCVLLHCNEASALALLVIDMTAVELPHNHSRRVSQLLLLSQCITISQFHCCISNMVSPQRFWSCHFARL